MSGVITGAYRQLGSLSTQSIEGLFYFKSYMKQIVGRHEQGVFRTPWILACISGVNERALKGRCQARESLGVGYAPPQNFTLI